MVRFRCLATSVLLVLAFASGATFSAAQPEFRLVWESGFENGFPAEWHHHLDDAWSPSGKTPPQRVSAWTIASRQSGALVHSGEFSYLGWIVGPSNISHRAYPVIHAGDPDNIRAPIRSPLLNTFMVWLDCDYDSMGPKDWVHFATWANNAEWLVHTLSVRDRKLEFAHVEPFHGEYIGPVPVPDFPLRQWVRLTVYIEYTQHDGFVQVWQDGAALLRARIRIPGEPALLRAHWGLYASPAVSRAVMYNDDIRIWTLDRPLANLLTEPLPADYPRR